MYVVATLFHGEFWTIFTKAPTERMANKYRDICVASRGERCRVMTQQAWDMAAGERRMEALRLKEERGYVGLRRAS